VARRLLGRRPGAQQLQERVDAVTALGTARYLHNRIQSTAEEKPGRHPDMSTAATAAMRAVLAEVGGIELCPRWEALRQLMDGSQLAMCFMSTSSLIHALDEFSLPMKQTDVVVMNSLPRQVPASCIVTHE
jgi:hypothetical protein